MRESGKQPFFDYTVNHEGFTPYPYADTLNLVSSGIGNLLDAGPQAPPSAGTSKARARLNNVVSAAAMAPMFKLPWKVKGPNWNPDPKSPNLDTRGDATNEQITAAWVICKTQNEKVPDFSQNGGGAYKNLTNITLDMQGMRALYDATFNGFESTLLKRYPGYDSWPVDAQFALMSMAWAMGPSFDTKFPQFKAAVDRKDFTAAADLCFFQGGGGTLSTRTGRNADNKTMFLNAAMVERVGADSTLLIFPKPSGTIAPAPVRIPLIATTSTLIKTAEVGGAVVVTGGILYGLYRWLKGSR